MFVGILIGGIAVYKKIPIIAGIILIGMVFLYCTDSPYLAQFLNSVGTYK